MSKVIAIMDRPENCQKCWFSMCYYSLPLSTRRKGYSCRLKEPNDRVVEDFDYDEEVHLKNCPLREIPQRAYHENFCDAGRYDKGYNDCLDEILKTSEQQGKQTNFERIKAMTMDELADAMMKIDSIEVVVPFCGVSARCNDILDEGELIPEGMCKQCLMNWLQAEVEV